MKLEFEQKMEDIIDLSRDSLKSNNSIKYMGIIFLILILVNVAAGSMKDGINFESLLSWFIPIIIIGLIWYFIMKFVMKRKLNDPGNKKMMLGKRVIELLDEELLVETPIAKTTYKWSAITKLRQ